MDAFNFIHFLKNPGYLHQVTFQEINNLIEQYPFCQNLHYLALRKAQHENHKDFVKKLELAATYSPNRQWLYKQLQEVQVAMSDEPLAEEPVVNDIHSDDVLIAPSIAVDEVSKEVIPTPVFYQEAEPEMDYPANEIDEATNFDIENEEEEDDENDINEIPEELEGEAAGGIENEPKDHQELNDIPQETEPFENDQITSHSISDSDPDISTEMINAIIPEIEPIDNTDANLENPEDMKLPDDKDRKVIYMEDLVNEIPPLEVNPTEAPTDEIYNNSITSDHSEPDAEEEIPQESTSMTDTELEEKNYANIPFEIYDPRDHIDENMLEETEEPIEIPSEGEISEADTASDLEMEINNEDTIEEDDDESEEEGEFSFTFKTEHQGDDYREQIDQAASPSDSIENIPFAAIENNNDDLDNEEEEEMEEDVDAPDEFSTDGEPEKPDRIAPMPKSAFSSWQQNKKMDIPPLEKKKDKKKKDKRDKDKKEQNKKEQHPTVMEVADLFKKEKKGKKKKKDIKDKTKLSKKKSTKRFAKESLLEHEDVISETLAEIVAEQGRKKKAIKMYQQLMKINPEKKAIYLDRIEELSKE